jgi:hypothetical protein
MELRAHLPQDSLVKMVQMAAATVSAEPVRLGC